MTCNAPCTRGPRLPAIDARTATRTVAGLFALALPLAALSQPATAWPVKPLRVVVPFPPGSAADAATRVITVRLSEQFGQQMVIDNRSGASGNIGADIVARAAPDGYTTLVGTTSTHAVAVSLNEKLTYDPVKDFAPVTLFGSSPYIVLVHPSVPVATMKELVAHAKARPGQVNYASAGNASLAHLGTELFASMAGVKMNHVPYKSSALSVLDLVAGRIDLLFGTPAPVLPHLRAGKLRALAATSAKRASFIPELPTVAEAGFPGYSLNLWFGLFAPAGTSKAVVERLNTGTHKVLALPDTREALALQGLEPAPTTPAEFAALLRAEIERWRKASALVHRAN
ncbi:MAG: tripartite tricarboxylate transporter substrate binding protein [Betaproteobacteria bacterium]|jgi:tripartite-type tricarboxylate transporter receptor subunit TctC|nr:tripartite tricarboxylate transporter substrate binding protein [Betaproteobacteria bacterium]